jgi:DNA-binding NarL/FixJ family response regulator
MCYFKEILLIMTKVVLVEPYTLMRQSVKRTLEQIDEVKTVVEVVGLQEASRALYSASPVVFLLGVSISAVECLKFLILIRDQKNSQRFGVVALLTNPSPQILLHLSNSGINGLLDKDSTERELATAITAAAEGNIFLSRHIHDLLKMNVVQKAGELTLKEKRVLLLVSYGESNKSIACKLKMKVKTVEGHLTRIYMKLGVGSRVQAAIYVQESWSQFQLPEMVDLLSTNISQIDTPREIPVLH